MISPRFAEDMAEKSTDPVSAAVWALVAQAADINRTISRLALQDENLHKALIREAVSNRIDDVWLKKARASICPGEMTNE